MESMGNFETLCMGISVMEIQIIWVVVISAIRTTNQGFIGIDELSVQGFFDAVIFL
jgi:hypothetical protein